MAQILIMLEVEPVVKRQSAIIMYMYTKMSVYMSEHVHKFVFETGRARNVTGEHSPHYVLTAEAISTHAFFVTR